MYRRFITKDSSGKFVPKNKISKLYAEELIYQSAKSKGILKGLDNFINGKGNGNKIKKLKLTQNQYDALFSFMYNNGPSVFKDSKFDEWMSYSDGEYHRRAKARIKLRDYIINYNGYYIPEIITELFVEAKGPNMKYDYEIRRQDEAETFNK